MNNTEKCTYKCNTVYNRKCDAIMYLFIYLYADARYADTCTYA